MTPYDLLRAELARDGTRPFVTFYDDATGERVELSVATFDNWVAKTAGLLRDGLSAQPGDRVMLLLPPHWQALVWACACWAVGATVVLEPDDSADVAVVGPDTLDSSAGAPETVALSLRPLGGRFTTALPSGVFDYAIEAPGYPDQLRPYIPPADHEAALESGTDVLTFAELKAKAHARAAELKLEVGARTLVSTEDLAVAALDALLVPLVTSGSAVLVRHEDITRRQSRAASERVTDVCPA